MSADRSKAHHLPQIKQATTEAARLWKACAWLIAEARRAHRLEEVTTVVLGLVELVRKRLPLPEMPQELAREVATTAAPRVSSWHARAGAHPTTQSRREKRAA